ncbi:MAG: hypothetical protein U1F43_22130 [Myxococcota bacterium]
MRASLIGATLVGALALNVALPAAPAQAKNMDGRFGLGLEQSLGGVTGLAVRYFLTEALCLQGTLGVDITVIDNNGKTDVEAGALGSAGIAFHFARGLHAHFSAGLRATLAYRSLDAFQAIVDPTATASDLQVAIELPLAMEVWLADNLSFGASTGILVNFVPSSGAQLHAAGAGGTAPPGGIGIGIGAGAVTATLALIYYF